MTYHYRQARSEDLDSVARVFASAFPESIGHYFDRPPAPRVVAEPFALCLEAEPEAFLVADAGPGQIAGYIFAPSATSRLVPTALLGGFLFSWLWRWVSGHYQIGWAPVRGLVANQVDFWRSALAPRVKADARILSIAVHPEHQGRGIAGRLCAMGLERLDRLGARPVRLEVRPDNTPAVRLYTRLGFQEIGRTRDSQGDWMIMLREAPMQT
jgi:[ribosomal protein S18]-alanine N-acetyltransferase